MFGLFKKDELGQLRKLFERVSERAMQAQRNGNIELFSELSEEAEKIGKKIDELEKAKKN